MQSSVPGKIPIFDLMGRIPRSNLMRGSSKRLVALDADSN
jgi:hypothetical protein